MMNDLKNWVGLLVLCLLLLGCGGDEPTAEIDPLPEEPDEIPTQIEVIVEPSEAMLFVDGDSRPSVELVRELLADETVGYPAMAQITVDDADSSQSRVTFRVAFKAIEGRMKEGAIEGLADMVYEPLSKEFNAMAAQSIEDEMIYHKAQAQAAAGSVKELQQSLKAFQETRRGLPQTDASRLERRKLERQIENVLQAQIDADKLVTSLQKKVDRGQHATLQRVR